MNQKLNCLMVSAAKLEAVYSEKLKIKES